MTAALELDGVHVRFGGAAGRGPGLRNRGVRHRGIRNRGDGVHALVDVNLTIAPGERVAIVGRSGAGKSTIARLACGLTRPSEGQVHTLGVDLSTLGRRELRALRQRLHLVFQDPYQSLHPGLDVRRIVSEPLAISGVGAAERQMRVTGALASAGLTPPELFLDRRAGSLSGGQRQRVAIARALVAAPELILADEPTSMLDASLRATIADLLLDLQAGSGDLPGQAAEPAALMFITHDLALARHVADRVVVLANGSVVEDRPTEELLADPDHPETRALVSAARHSRPTDTETGGAVG